MIRAFITLVFSFTLIHSTVSQKVYSLVEGGDITWASASYFEPNWGFYGQEFELAEDSEVLSLSIYIYDHKNHNETKSKINFAVWSYDGQPSSEIYQSEAQSIRKDQVGGWMEYEFPTPLSLRAGTYFFAVGQPTIQGFVAFGSQKRTAAYSGKKWMRVPLPDREISDGSEWMNMRDLASALEKMTGEGGIDIEELENVALMMKIKLSE